jgi:hypothetical protein
VTQICAFTLELLVVVVLLLFALFFAGHPAVFGAILRILILRTGWSTSPAEGVLCEPQLFAFMPQNLS